MKIVKTTTKAILLNAPKEVGKDCAIDYLMEQGIHLVVRECKDHLHKLVMNFFCVDEMRYWNIYDDRQLKEVPLPEFQIDLTSDYSDYCFLEEILGYDLQGNHLEDCSEVDMLWELRYKNHPEDAYGTCLNLSIREAMIYVSEVVMKSRFGEDYFGKARAKSVREGEVIIDGSCAFVDELHPLIEKIGMENILLIRIHRDGYTFEGDSRDYIPDGVITNTVDVDNNSTLEDYLKKVETVVRGFI